MLTPDQQDIDDVRQEYPRRLVATRAEINRAALIVKLKRTVAGVQDDTIRDILETIISLL
jgi:hypothetical protein